MKHIEPGCLAIIINSAAPSNIGKTVRIIEKIDSDITYTLNVGWFKVTFEPVVHQRWLVDLLDGKVIVAVTTLTNEKIYSERGVCREQWLMRIGDEDYAKQVKEVLENVH